MGSYSRSSTHEQFPNPAFPKPSYRILLYLRFRKKNLKEYYDIERNSQPVFRFFQK